MVESTQPRISTGASLREGFSSLLKPPFRGLLLLALLITLVLDTLPVQGDDATVIATLILFGLSLYLQIATTLAVVLLLAGILALAIPTLAGLLGPRRPSQIKSMSFEAGSESSGLARREPAQARFFARRAPAGFPAASR